MRKIKLHKGNFTLEDEVIGFIEKSVTKFGSGAKIDCRGCPIIRQSSSARG